MRIIIIIIIIILYDDIMRQAQVPEAVSFHFIFFIFYSFKEGSPSVVADLQGAFILKNVVKINIMKNRFSKT